jgi:hypothetical protein
MSIVLTHMCMWLEGLNISVLKRSQPGAHRTAGLNCAQFLAVNHDLKKEREAVIYDARALPHDPRPAAQRLWTRIQEFGPYEGPFEITHAPGVHTLVFSDAMTLLLAAASSSSASSSSSVIQDSATPAVVLSSFIQAASSSIRVPSPVVIDLSSSQSPAPAAVASSSIRVPSPLVIDLSSSQAPAAESASIQVPVAFIRFASSSLQAASSSLQAASSSIQAPDVIPLVNFFDPQLFTDIPGYLLCSKCHNVLNEPHGVTREDTVLYCQGCILPSGSGVPIFFPRGVISKWQTRCPGHERGCSWTGAQQDMVSHWDTCGFHRSTCPHCHQWVAYENKEQHVRPTEHKCSQETTFACQGQAERHIKNDCPNTEIQCDYCPQQLLRGAMPKHLESQATLHIAMLLPIPMLFKAYNIMDPIRAVVIMKALSFQLRNKEIVMNHGQEICEFLLRVRDKASQICKVFIHEAIYNLARWCCPSRYLICWIMETFEEVSLSVEPSKRADFHNCTLEAVLDLIRRAKPLGIGVLKYLLQQEAERPLIQFMETHPSYPLCFSMLVQLMNQAQGQSKHIARIVPVIIQELDRDRSKTTPRMQLLCIRALCWIVWSNTHTSRQDILRAVVRSSQLFPDDVDIKTGICYLYQADIKKHPDKLADWSGWVPS